MGTFLGLVALLGLFLWLVGGKRKSRTVQPEDDVETPLDRSELEEAERELAADDEAKLRDGIDEDEDDWGPGRA